MKSKILSFATIIILVTSIQSAYAKGFWNDFAQGAAETSKRRECERTYSPAMCVQMENDKRERAEQERHNREIQWELQQQRQEIDTLKQRQR